MTSDRNKPGFLFWATVVVVVVLPLYIGAYASTVHTQVPFTVPENHTGRPILFKMPVYYYGDFLGFGFVFTEESGWGKVFAPIHAVDQAVRPKRWTFWQGSRPPRPSILPRPSTAS
jgi:hypothetical protein